MDSSRIYLLYMSCQETFQDDHNTTVLFMPHVSLDSSFNTCKHSLRFLSQASCEKTPFSARLCFFCAQ